MLRFESSRIACVEWLHDRVANFYLLFGTDLPRIASYTAAAGSISYFRRHTVLKIPNSYFQMLTGMHSVCVLVTEIYFECVTLLQVLFTVANEIGGK